MPLVAGSRARGRFEHVLKADRPIGTARVYTWNPRCQMLTELRALLRRALELQSPEDTLKHFRERRRPRRTGKPRAG